jgi:adenylate kinase
MLRDEVREGTPLGLEAKRYMDAGDLVPDDVVIGMLRSRVGTLPDPPSFLLDGFPRTVPQAEALDAALEELGAPLDVVLLLTVDRDELVRRLSGRWICRDCGRSWHEVSNPPPRGEACERTGRPHDMYQRADDRPEAVLRRLKVYDQQTAPLADYYRQRGLLREIDGQQPPDEVHGQIQAAVPAA